MIEKNQIYKCSSCGNIIEVLVVGGGPLVCCGKPMELMIEKTQDQGAEKHVPVVTENEVGIKVKIGSVEHPMEGAHYIQWIEVIVDGKSYKEFLSPGQKPEAEFCVRLVEGKGDEIVVRAYCNIHGLWKK